MRHLNRHIQKIVLVCWHGLIVLAVTACGPSKNVSGNAPTEVHGELIASTPAAQPISTAVAATPVVSAPTAVAAIPASPTPATSPEVQPAKVFSAVPEYASVGFDRLASYNFEVENAPVTNLTAGVDKANDQIPATVKAFDRKKVSIRGFMLPLKVSNGLVTEFLIMKDQSLCCYGSVPKITEWVSVKTPERGVKSIMDEPVSIMGTLHVGAMRENGYLIGIYQMDGDKLIAPEN
jgi:hypothetical protein